MKTNKITELLKEETEFIFPIRGKSMLPLFRQKKDTVIISNKELESVKKYDIVLFDGPNGFILHRIIKIKNGVLIIRGDNTFTYEFVSKNDIQGKVTGFYRNDKLININKTSLKIYIRLWNIIYPLRYLFHLMKKAIKKSILWKRK